MAMLNIIQDGQVKESQNNNKKLTKHCKEDKIPVVGGNVSLYNSTGSSSIRPTPILLMLGITK